VEILEDKGSRVSISRFINSEVGMLMETKLIDYSLNPFEGIQIWASTCLGVFPNQLNVKSSKVDALGSKPLEETLWKHF
jgi:hypothetical protein